MKQCLFRVGSMLVCTESVAEFIDNETYKEVAIVEKSVVKQCVSCVGSVFEFASATICALIVSQLELECTESEGSRKSGSELGRYCGNKGPGCSLSKVLWVAWFMRQVL